MDKITALMVTIPQRENVVQKVVDSIYDQVDELRIVFNDFESIPDWASKKNKIVSFLNTPDKYTSNAVWLSLTSDVNGFVFVVDDDILYPPNYVSTMVDKLEMFNRKVVVVVHGAIVKPPIQDYKKSRLVFHFRKKLKKNTFVDIAGCGTLAFHTNTIRPKLNDFSTASSRDLLFSILTHKQNVPILCLSRGSGWLVSIKTSGTTIWEETLQNKFLYTKKNEIMKNELGPLLLKNTNG